jgi:hypothetical protein
VTAWVTPQRENAWPAHSNRRVVAWHKAFIGSVLSADGAQLLRRQRWRAHMVPRRACGSRLPPCTSIFLQKSAARGRKLPRKSSEKLTADA